MLAWLGRGPLEPGVCEVPAPRGAAPPQTTPCALLAPRSGHRTWGACSPSATWGAPDGAAGAATGRRPSAPRVTAPTGALAAAARPPGRPRQPHPTLKAGEACVLARPGPPGPPASAQHGPPGLGFSSGGHERPPGASRTFGGVLLPGPCWCLGTPAQVLLGSAAGHLRPRALLAPASLWPGLLLGSRAWLSHPHPAWLTGPLLPIKTVSPPSRSPGRSLGESRLGGQDRGLCPWDWAGRGCWAVQVPGRVLRAWPGHQGSPRLARAGSGPPAAPVPAPARPGRAPPPAASSLLLSATGPGSRGQGCL